MGAQPFRLRKGKTLELSDDRASVLQLPRTSCPRVRLSFRVARDSTGS